MIDLAQRPDPPVTIGKDNLTQAAIRQAKAMFAIDWHTEKMAQHGPDQRAM